MTDAIRGERPGTGSSPGPTCVPTDGVIRLEFHEDYRSPEAHGGSYLLPPAHLRPGPPGTLEAFWDELLPGACSPLDSHEAVELWFIASGRGRLVLDGADYHLAPGHAVFIPSGATHQVWCTGDEPLVTYSLAWS